jgi:hypothetical protein
VGQRGAQPVDRHGPGLRLPVERVLHGLRGEGARFGARVQLAVRRSELEIEMFGSRRAPDEAERGEEPLHRLDRNTVALLRVLHVPQLRRIAGKAELRPLEREHRRTLRDPVEHQYGTRLLQPGEIVKVGRLPEAHRVGMLGGGQHDGDPVGDALHEPRAAGRELGLVERLLRDERQREREEQ